MFVAHKTSMFCVKVCISGTHANICTPKAQVSNFALSLKVAEVNGEISVSQEVNIERSADTSEDAQADQVCPLEPDAVIQNGAVEEMEVEREAQVSYLVQVEVKVELLQCLSNLYTLPLHSLNVVRCLLF